MGWVRVDDAFYDHHKFINAGPLGVAQWIAGLAWCNRNLKDGFIPTSKAHGLLDWDGLLLILSEGAGFANSENVDGEIVSAILVDAGLWEKTPKGYVVHDYHDFQPTADEVRERQEETRESRIRAGQQRAAGASRTTGGQFKTAGQTSTASTATSTTASTTTSGSPAPTPNPTPIVKNTRPFEDDFEQAWREYPKKAGKGQAFRAYQSRRRAGRDPQLLFTATCNYAKWVKAQGTKDRYIKHGSTFFGPDEPWTDYLEDTLGRSLPDDNAPVVRSQRHIALGDVSSYRKSGQTKKADDLQALIDAGEFD